MNADEFFRAVSRGRKAGDEIEEEFDAMMASGRSTAQTS
jgi:hypothetical protein